MCGIVGYTGEEQAAPILLEGLQRLEYRGYDSAGVAVYSKGQIKIAKTKGYVRELSDLIDGGKAVTGTTGLGHTRWATHGQPSDVNSHPHMSFGGKIAAVHNGIIENYVPLRRTLESKGYIFQSDTDTEVAVNLIQYYYHGDIMQAVAQASRRMVGSYALGIVCSDNPETLIAVRRESPLIIGSAEHCNFLASDVTAVIKYTRDIYYLDDGEMAVLTKDAVKFYNSELEPVDKALSRVEWDVSAAEKGGYEHFMFKEIMEQPDAVRKTISPRIRDRRVVFDEISLSDEYIRDIEKIYIIACGSAYHVGVVAKYNLEKLARIPTEAVLASEFRYASPMVSKKTLVICISQSGTTADTIAALREAKRLGARVLSVVNVVGSTIAKESDDVIYTWAGPEIAVATTKAYSTQLAVMCMVALYMAEKRGAVGEKEYTEIVDGLVSLPDDIQSVLNAKETIQYYASIYFGNEYIFFIGRNIDYALSLEGSLKLKEISYIHSEAYAAGELKHGTISLIESGTLVFTVASYKPLVEKTLSNAEEVRSRGAVVLALTTESCAELVSHSAGNVITIPDVPESLLPSLAVVPMQLFAYYVALMRGCSIDKPRNLAKSVTVE